MKYQNKADALLDKILLSWVSGVIRHAWWCILAILILTCCSLYYTVNHLGINTDTTEMLSADLQFRKDQTLLNRTFPDDSRAVLVVITSTTPELTETAVRTLRERFRDETGVVESVYTPNENPFFNRQALLFLDVGQLDKLAMEITRAQPFLGRLAQNNTLGELLKLLNHAIQHPDGQVPVQLNALLSDMTKTVQAVLEDRQHSVSWQKLMLGQESDFNQSIGFILVRPIFDYNDLVPADKSFQAIRAISRNFEQNNPGVRVRMTGEVALEHEELESVSQGTEIAGIVSLILVCISLLWGLRSVRLAVATLVSLIVGLILSAGFATVSIGHLNLISVAFAVLYIGLGVDYAIHLSLRFQDMINSGSHRDKAVTDSLRCVGPSIILCTLTTSIGFYAFVPTAYEGVSELGIISGTAMYIGLFVTLTLLPALLIVLPANWKAFQTGPGLLPLSLYSFPIQRARWVKIGTVVLAFGGLWTLGNVTFDFDPISLRDQNSESVTTFRELLKRKEASPLVISVLAKDQQDAVNRATRLRQLDSVNKVISILDFIPEDQEEKIEIIEVLDESLGPRLVDFQPVGDVDVAGQILEIKSLVATLALNHVDSRAPTSDQPVQLRLRDQLKQLLVTLETSDPKSKKNLLAAIQQGLLANLAQTIGKLTTALKATEFETIGDLPKSFDRRWVSSDGIFRLLVFPEKDLNDLSNLKEFVEDVQSIEPRASDLPVFYAESGKEVVKAFQQALCYAVTAITLIAFLILRNIKETALVLLPLFLAAILTGAATVLFDNPFNFANIIVLPLLMGLGIDSSIHVVHRLRIMHNKKQDILQTSTARGIFFSGLTTAFSFTSLAFISHAGTASLGLLLTIGIVLTLFCTLIVLPAFAVGKPKF